MSQSRLALLVQLPIPPPGPGILEGNEPLAAAYLKLYARRQGLENACRIEVFPPAAANVLGDQGVVHAILARQPWLVGFTCYLWNVERTLWVVEHVRRAQPDVKIVLGGPEITPDNQWLLQRAAGSLGDGAPLVDYAVFGEGEVTFAELLASLLGQGDARTPIGGLWRAGEPAAPLRAPLERLDAISSPYVEGILDVSSRRMLFETARGCRYRCKYCYYPKGESRPRQLATEQVLANLKYAIDHDVEEVVLLDPTLNQRPDFVEFIELLRRENPAGRLRFSAELRAEGIDRATARLLREAGFHEVEIGLQSVEPEAWKLMGRPTNLVEFERGVRAMLDQGIEVRTDLILGLPGDTPDSIRRGIDFLASRKLCTEAQVFNLSILPGTAFRQQAAQLGLKHQPWPPYYAIRTPTLDVELLSCLMEEAQEAFDAEFDPLPTPQLDLFRLESDSSNGCRIDLDDASQTGGASSLVGGSLPSLCFTLWLRSADFHGQRHRAATIIDQLLGENPHTTLQVVIEPTDDPRRISEDTLGLLLAACYRSPTYLDRYYSLHPGRLLGSKRLIVVLPPDGPVDEAWRRGVAEYATLL
ncbi:MAG: radical SAM protein [Thermoguttaceae bacterium]